MKSKNNMFGRYATSGLSALLAGCLWLAPPAAGEQAAFPVEPILSPAPALAEEEVCALLRQAKGGDPAAQYRFAIHCGKQRNDLARAVEWIRRSAEQGYPEAISDLSVLYHEGRGVPQDDRRAFSLAQRAVELGCIESCNNLGVYCLTGSGAKADPRAALGYFLRGAEAGDPLAQHNLAGCYLRGIGTPRDLPRAICWFRKAARQGHLGSRMLLASSYMKGENGFEKNPEEGVAFLRMAAEDGNAPAQFQLALYENEAQHIDESIRWLQKAADQGDADAQNALGSSYIQGVGVPQNFARATELIRQAALQGHLEAQTNMGDLCSAGIGLPKNNLEAVKWYRLAAQKGYARAQNSLGISYMDGTLPLDRAAAQFWFEKSAAQNDAHGQYLLGCIYAGEDPPNEKKAFELFLKAARQGLAEAEANAGFCYYNGAGTEKNLQQAVHWLRNAYRKGQPFALQLADETRQKVDSGDKDAQVLMKAFAPWPFFNDGECRP